MLFHHFKYFKCQFTFIILCPKFVFNTVVLSIENLHFGAFIQPLKYSTNIHSTNDVLQLSPNIITLVLSSSVSSASSITLSMQSVKIYLFIYKKFFICQLFILLN